MKFKIQDSQSFSMCHASATTFSLSPFFAEIVTISAWISVGSCTSSVCLEEEDETFIGGESHGGGARRERAVGEGRDELDEDAEWELDMDGGGEIIGGGCRNPGSGREGCMMRLVK